MHTIYIYIVKYLVESLNVKFEVFCCSLHPQVCFCNATVEAVNLVPAEKPQDVYTFVLNVVKKKAGKIPLSCCMSGNPAWAVVSVDPHFFSFWSLDSFPEHVKRG